MSDKTEVYAFTKEEAKEIAKDIFTENGYDLISTPMGTNYELLVREA